MIYEKQIFHIYGSGEHKIKNRKQVIMRLLNLSRQVVSEAWTTDGSRSNVIYKIQVVKWSK